ncbi:glycoside hydrolase family 32 protein [Formicincola oecophyllae]|uniref:beta-fructofuranosidase n=1 Tax=Formicincola oecophyllae TaxID=2558361 RepID=A0A4Y6UCF3_9PROT|nr:glycoside hydrolase family 32 protein [Formicincola oecophyllae]QDH14166.1 glycoside hydrolase family 32 protein [Formicincola oecophyllae]
MVSTYYPLAHAAVPQSDLGLEPPYWYGGNDVQTPYYDAKSGKWVFFMLGTCRDIITSNQLGWLAWTTTDFQSWQPQGLFMNPGDYTSTAADGSIIQGFTAIWGGGAFGDPDNLWGFGSDAVLFTASIANPETPGLKPENMAVGLFVCKGGIFNDDGTLKKPAFVRTLTDITTAQSQGWVNDKPSTPLDGDFRDARMSWDPVHRLWVLAVSVSYGVAFFTCANPASGDFTFASAWIGPDRTLGQPGGVECPSFLYHQGQWVLVYSDQANQFQKVNGQKLLRQCVMACKGTWDGKNFTNTTTPATLDRGFAHYAQAVFTDQKGRLLEVGWYNNWNFRSGTAQIGWDGFMSCVREIDFTGNTPYVLDACAPDMRAWEAASASSTASTLELAAAKGLRDVPSNIPPLPPGGVVLKKQFPGTIDPNFMPQPTDTPPAFRWGRAYLFGALQGSTWPDDGVIFFRLAQDLAWRQGVTVTLNPHAGNITINASTAGVVIGDAGVPNPYAAAPVILPYDFSRGWFLLQANLDSCSLEVFTDQGTVGSVVIFPGHDQVFLDISAPPPSAYTGDPTIVGTTMYNSINIDPATWLSQNQESFTLSFHKTDGTESDVTIPLPRGPKGDPGTSGTALLSINTTATVTEA